MTVTRRKVPHEDNARLLRAIDSGTRVPSGALSINTALGDEDMLDECERELKTPAQLVLFTSAVALHCYEQFNALTDLRRAATEFLCPPRFSAQLGRVRARIQGPLFGWDLYRPGTRGGESAYVWRRRAPDCTPGLTRAVCTARICRCR